MEQRASATTTAAHTRAGRSRMLANDGHRVVDWLGIGGRRWDSDTHGVGDVRSTREGKAGRERGDSEEEEGGGGGRQWGGK